MRCSLRVRVRLLRRHLLRRPSLHRLLRLRRRRNVRAEATRARAWLSWERGRRTEVLPPVDADVAGHSGTTGAAFQIQLSARSNEVQVGADAELVVTLKNMTDKELLFPHRPGTGNAEFSYVIVVRNVAGKVLGETTYGREARERQQTEARTVDYVQPGQTSAQTTNLARLVNLSKPGEYRVRVSRRDAVTKTMVESNEITLDVVP